MIDLLPSTDDEAIVDSVRDYLTAEMPIDRFRQAGRGWSPGDFDKWREFAELGWFLGADPEGGIDVALEGLIFRELGRHLVTPAVLSTVLAAHLARSEGQDELAARLIAGQQHVGLAYAVTGGLHIMDAAPDSLFLTYGEEGFALWEPKAAADRKNLDPFDPTIVLTGARPAPGARPLVRSGSQDLGLLHRARVLTAAMNVGSAEASLVLATDYAKIRNAFGRPIGAFQAIQHKCADMKLRCEESLDQLLFASLCVREGMFEPDFQVAALAALSANAADKNGAACIQVHGGMGFTFECEAHYHLKRAHALKWLWGGPLAQRKRLLEPASVYDA